MGHEIPKQLQNEKFRFVLIAKNSKRPIEDEWPTKANYKFNDPKLIKHLKDGNNYGVLCGPGNLFVIDIDVKNAKPKDFESFKNLETFMVLTGGGGLHIYLLCSDEIVGYENETLSIGELKIKGVQVVGPNSTYTNGLTKYNVIKENEVVIIAKDKFDRFYEEIISPYKKKTVITDELQNVVGESSGDTSRSGIDFKTLRFLIQSNLTKEKIFEQMKESSIRWNSLPKKKQEWEYGNAKKSLEKFPEKSYKQRECESQLSEGPQPEFLRDTINASILFDQELKPIEYHVNKLIPKNSLILIGGNSGEFKTGLVLNLILSMIKGSSFLELFPAIDNPKILYYEVDGNGKKSIQWKLKYFVNGNNYNKEVLKQIDFEYLFYQDFLKTELDNIEKYDIIILDSYRRFLKGSENDSKNTNDFFLNFLKIAKAKKKTVIVLHHLKKPADEQELIHAFRGNTDIVSQFDVVYGIEKTPDNQDVKNKTNIFDVKVVCAKDRDDAVIKGFSFNVFKDEKIVKTALKFTGYGKAQSKRARHVILILEYLEDGIKSRQEILKRILEKCRCSVPTIDRGLAELVETQEIEKDSYGKYKIRELNAQTTLS